MWCPYPIVISLFTHVIRTPTAFSQDSTTPPPAYQGGFPGEFATKNITLTSENPQLTLQYNNLVLSWGMSRFSLKRGFLILRVDGDGQALQVQGIASHLPQRPSGNLTQPACLNEYLTIYDGRYPFWRPLLSNICEQQSYEVTSYSDVILLGVVLWYVKPSVSDSWSLRITRVSCGKADLRCPSEKSKCVPFEKICDGKPDCPNGEDEICTTECGKPKVPLNDGQDNLRIIGGRATSARSWPWHLYLLNNGAGAACGASVIAPRWVLTAAHCLHGEAHFCSVEGNFKQRALLMVTYDTRSNRPSNITLTVLPQDCGSSLRKEYPSATAVKIFSHPLYQKADGFNYDMALVLLESDLGLADDGVQAICLPRPNMGPLAGEMCYVTGCGNQNQTHPGTPGVGLKQARLASMGSTCRWRPHPDILCLYGDGIDGSCFGDSGGPFVCEKPYPDGTKQWHQFGIASFVWNGKRCEQAASGYFKVKWSMPFIVETLYAEGFVGWWTNRTVPAPIGPLIREWDDETKVARLTESRNTVPQFSNETNDDTLRVLSGPNVPSSGSTAHSPYCVFSFLLELILLQKLVEFMLRNLTFTARAEGNK